MDNSSEGTKPKSTGFRGKRAKRKFGKNLEKKGQPGDRKATKQDLPQLRAELGLPPSANHAQICHAIQPAEHSESKCHSPPKRVLKDRLAKSNAILEKQAVSIHKLKTRNLGLEYDLATTKELAKETKKSQNAIRNATKVAVTILAEAEDKRKEAKRLREQAEAEYVNKKSEDRKQKEQELEQYNTRQ